MNKNLLLFFLFGLGLCSCKKSNDEKVGKSLHVYIAGRDGNYAVYWKDGVATRLTDGTRTAHATSIFVSGNDIYVAGSESNGTKDVAKYWKNGQEGFRTDGIATAAIYSIFVLGNDVYAAGSDFSVGVPGGAVIWKNKERKLLTPVGGRAMAITVSGADVFVTGWETSTALARAVYWKNAQLVPLTDGQHSAAGLALSVFDKDVFVAGSESNGIYPVAKYWKNGKAVVLTDGSKFSMATAIAVAGNDVFVAGNVQLSAGTYSYYSPLVWKNETLLPALTNEKHDALTTGIAVSGNDVYVSGYEQDGGHNLPKYWKNGTPVVLPITATYGTADAIFLSNE